MKLLLRVFTFFMMLLSVNSLANNTENLIKCAEQKDSLVRLLCYDEIVELLKKNDLDTIKKVGLDVNDPISSSTPSVTPSATSSATPLVEGKTANTTLNTLSPEKANSVKNNTASTAVEEFGSENIESKAEQQAKELNQVIFTIKSLKKTARGQWNIIFNNGQLWKQASSDTIRLVVGNKVEVSKAALGSYKLKKVGSNRSIRVKRLK
jgi:hypothetical protein